MMSIAPIDVALSFVCDTNQFHASLGQGSVLTIDTSKSTAGGNAGVKSKD